MKKPEPGCSVCGKKAGNDCSRVECGNRKTLTAAPPERGTVRLGVITDEDYPRWIHHIRDEE